MDKPLADFFYNRLLSKFALLEKNSYFLIAFLAKRCCPSFLTSNNKRIIVYSSHLLTSLWITPCNADTIVWSGEVNANGIPTELISLKLQHTYQITATGYVNLGKWVQNRKQLANDACYEFNDETFTAKVESLRNSSDISICDNNNSYRLDHIYQSKPFKAEQNRIFFWLYDTYYDDNTGSFKIEIKEIEGENSKPDGIEKEKEAETDK